MKFGKRLENEAMPEWRSEYFAYKKLKKVIKSLNNDDSEEDDLPDDPNERNKIFIDALLLELDKVENFFLLQSDGTVRRKVHLTNQLEDLEKEKTITTNDGTVTDLPRTLTRTSDRSGKDEPRNSEKGGKSPREGK
jgi:SPX domain protein involved in polyphosphate accumulation